MLSVKNRQARKVPGSLVDKTLAFDVTCIHICCCEVLGKLLNLPEPQFSYHAMGLITVSPRVIMETKQQRSI